MDCRGQAWSAQLAPVSAALSTTEQSCSCSCPQHKHNPDVLVLEQGLEEKPHGGHSFGNAAACPGDFLFPKKWDKYQPWLLPSETPPREELRSLQYRRGGLLSMTGMEVEGGNGHKGDSLGSETPTTPPEDRAVK